MIELSKYLGIKNSIPLEIVAVWIFIGLMMFITTLLWQNLDPLIEDCTMNISCLIFDIFMFFMHYLGILILVLGTFVLIGNEKQAQN